MPAVGRKAAVPESVVEQFLNATEVPGAVVRGISLRGIQIENIMRILVSPRKGESHASCSDQGAGFLP